MIIEILALILVLMMVIGLGLLLANIPRFLELLKTENRDYASLEDKE